MKVSRSTGYGLLAVCYIARNKNQKLVLSHEISEKYKIPLEYLLKIMQQLVRAKILRSKRGPRGGFRLAKPASRISMLEIIEAVDGSVTGGLRLGAKASREKSGKKIKLAHNKAVKEAEKVFQRTKLAALIK